MYNSDQTKKILKVINKTSDVIISIFIGRASDAGKDPLPELINSIRLTKKFKKVKILWASVREPYNYLQAKKLGCHIITVPPNICLLYTSPSPRDLSTARMPSSA